MTTGKSPASGIDRRLFLVSGLFAASLSLTGARAAWAQVGSPGGAALAPARMRFLSALCDTILPATDTPGALNAGVPAFIERIALRASTPEQLAALDGAMAALEQALDRRAGKPFAAAPAPLRAATLAALDAEAMAGRTDCRVHAAEDAGDAVTYRLLKAATVYGFYTSEAGGSQDLRFELVPGGYQPDIPLAADWRNFCNETVLG